MMTGMKKTLGILVVVFLILLVLSLLTTRRRLATTEGGGFVEIVPETLDEASIESIRGWIGSSPDTVVELKRSGDGWVVASLWDWPAKESQMTRLLDDLVGLSGELRSRKEAVFPDYQIGDASGFHLVADRSGGSEIFHLIVGKSSERGGCFVRTEGSNDVYITSAGLRSSFGLWGDEPKPPEGKRWADMQVFKVDTKDVDKIVLTSGDTETVLEKAFEIPEVPDSVETPPPDRSRWTWKPDAAGEIDKAKGDRVLNAVCSLYATEAVDPAKIDSLGLGDGARVAELTLSDGTVNVLRFGLEDEEKKRVYFQKEGTFPAEIAKTTVDRIFVTRDDLSPEEDD